MKKIPTLFKREFHEDGKFTLTDQVTEGMEWVLTGDGLATVKWDGTPVYYDGTYWFKRFDYKPGRKLPENAVPCQMFADPITGHWPHWIPLNEKDKSDKHIVAAIRNYMKYGSAQLAIGTYEAVGPNINGNHSRHPMNTLMYHGSMIITDFPRDFQRMGWWLNRHAIEGIVFWLNGKPMCKIKRSDFGYTWPLIFVTGKDGETS